MDGVTFGPRFGVLAETAGEDGVRHFTEIEITEISLNYDGSLFPDSEPVVVPDRWTSTVTFDVPGNLRAAQAIAHALNVPCYLLGVPWHPGCREEPHRSARHAAYHGRRR